MKNYYFEESGYYKIRKIIEAGSKEKAIKEYEDWLDYKIYGGDIDLESGDREITEMINGENNEG